MFKYRGPKLKLIRNLNEPIKAFTSKLKVFRKKKINPLKYAYKTTENVTNVIKSLSFDRLQEKKYFKLQYLLTDKQLKNIVKKALLVYRQDGNSLLNYIFYCLEFRLDNILFLTNFAATIAEARQKILHKQVLINNKIVKTPNILCKIGDLITVRIMDYNSSTVTPLHKINYINDVFIKRNHQCFKIYKNCLDISKCFFEFNIKILGTPNLFEELNIRFVEKIKVLLYFYCYSKHNVN